jgi:hypothetical protein
LKYLRIWDYNGWNPDPRSIDFEFETNNTGNVIP